MAHHLTAGLTKRVNCSLSRSMPLFAHCCNLLPTLTLCKVTDVIRLLKRSGRHTQLDILHASLRERVPTALHTSPSTIWSTTTCRIRGFHGGDYEAYRLPGCGDVSEEHVASIFRVEEVQRARKRFRRLLTD
jgi:hypothetical protein